MKKKWKKRISALAFTLLGVLLALPALAEAIVGQEPTIYLNGQPVETVVLNLSEGNQLQFAVPLSVLGLQANQVAIQFKVADNFLEKDGIYSFYLHGDAAPYGRLNYVYSSDGVAGIPHHIINERKAIPNGR